MKRKIIQLIYKSMPRYDREGNREQNERVTCAVCNDGSWWELIFVRDPKTGDREWKWEEQIEIPQDEETQ